MNNVLIARRIRLINVGWILMVKGVLIMRKWTKETARRYVERVEKGKQEIGLTYLSAKDFLKNHKKGNSIIGV